jgi:hypothetical protein
MSSAVVSNNNEEPSIQSTQFSKKKIEEILRKYPDRIPVVISSKSFKSHNINRFIVPVDMTINQFMIILRNKTKLKEMEAIFIFVKDGSLKNKSNNRAIREESLNLKMRSHLYISNLDLSFSKEDLYNIFIEEFERNHRFKIRNIEIRQERSSYFVKLTFEDINNAIDILFNKINYILPFKHKNKSIEVKF